MLPAREPHASDSVMGVDISTLVHEDDKSTKEGEWEIREDGKYYRRDYYSAKKEATVTAPHDPCPEKDRTISHLRIQLTERDTLIADLRARVALLEQQLSGCLASQNNRAVAAPPPPPPQVQLPMAPAQPDSSYYMVRSQRGADLLAQYGRSRTEIVINPNQQLPAMQMGVPTNVPAYYNYTAVQPMQQQVRVEQQVAVQQERAVHAAMETVTEHQTETHQTQHEYYRVADEETKRRLDLMDGVEDGKLGGAEIHVVGDEALSRSAGSVTRGSGSVQSREVKRSYYNVDDTAQAARLDAADGVMDGKFDGAEINVTHSGGGVHTSVHTHEFYNAHSAEELARLDALDGVMDGKLNGTEIIVGDSSQPKPKKRSTKRKG